MMRHSPLFVQFIFIISNITFVNDCTLCIMATVLKSEKNPSSQQHKI